MLKRVAALGVEQEPSCDALHGQRHTHIWSAKCHFIGAAYQIPGLHTATLQLHHDMAAFSSINL